MYIYSRSIRYGDSSSNTALDSKSKAAIQKECKIIIAEAKLIMSEIRDNDVATNQVYFSSEGIQDSLDRINDVIS